MIIFLRLTNYKEVSNKLIAREQDIDQTNKKLQEIEFYFDNKNKENSNSSLFNSTAVKNSKKFGKAKKDKSCIIF